MDSVAFAKAMIQEAEAFGDYMDKHILSHWEPFEDNAQTIRLLQTAAWREFHLGIPTVARQIDKLPDEDEDIKLLLARQLAEELLHWKICSDRVEELGGDGNLAGYTPTREDLAIYRNTYLEEPLEIASGLQIFGETILIHTTRRMIEVVDPRTAVLLRDEVLIHEGSHVRIGRLILERHATTPEAQETVREIGRKKFESVMEAYPYALPDFEIR